MKIASAKLVILFGLGYLLLATSMPVRAQLTTWEEDVEAGKVAEAKNNLLEAERKYRQALRNFGYGSGFEVWSATGSAKDEECAETLRSLLRVLYAEKKLTSAVPICMSLVKYIETNSSGPHDPALVTARANLKKLIDQVEIDSRKIEVAQIMKQHNLIGMSRTGVHRLLGTPQSAAHKFNHSITVDSGPVSGSGTVHFSDTPMSDMPADGVRDYYILSRLKGDPPQGRGYGNGDYTSGQAQTFSSLDVDYADDTVVKYRIRSFDGSGKWIY